MADFKTGVELGDVLKGKYKILQKIGEGGFSHIYLAIDLELSNKQWAIKEVVRSGMDASGRSIESSIKAESEILSRLDHPNIVSIHDVLKTSNYIYIVMDHVEGESLARVLRREGVQSEENVQSWMLQLCDALSYLHEQDPPIIFRDIKPSNIMLRPDGYIKLIDFGVVREYKDNKSQDTVAFGTEGFASPEAHQGQTDSRSDIYGIGATIWNLLTGVVPPYPVEETNIREYNPNVSEGFADVIIPKCMAYMRSERYQNCEELASDLERYQQLTKDFRNQQAKKVKISGGFGIAAAAFLVVGFACGAARTAIINNEFDSLIAQAQAQSEPSIAEERYLAAIEKKPGIDGKEAYEALISLYKDDGVFSAEEKETFTRIYDSNLSNLSVNSADAAELFFDIGELYWAYSDGNDSELTRIKSAESFFKKAQEYGGVDFDLREEAEAYYALVEYAKNVERIGKEANVDIDFAQEWDYFSSLVSADLDPVVQMHNYKLICSQIVEFGTYFREAGVTSAQVSNLLETIESNMNSYNSATKDSALYSETISSLSPARSYVSVTWSSSTGG